MTRKVVFFEGWSWFKFNNFKLALGTNLKFYISVAKGLKGNVRKFLGLVPTFVEVTREKLVGGSLFASPPILKRVNKHGCDFDDITKIGYSTPSWPYSGWVFFGLLTDRGAKKPLSLKSVRHILQWWNLAQLYLT